MNNSPSTLLEKKKRLAAQEQPQPQENQEPPTQPIQPELPTQEPKKSLLERKKEQAAAEKETWGGWLARNLASNTLRGIEGFTSAIPHMERDIDPQTVENLNLSIGKNPKLGQAVEQRKEFETETPQQRMRKSLAEYSKGYTEPKNKMENWINNVSEIGGALLSGRLQTGQMNPGGRDLVQRLYQDVAVPIVGATTKSATDSDKAAWVSMMIASLLSPRGTTGSTISNTLQNTMHELEAQVPPDRIIPMGPAIQRFTQTPTWIRLSNSLRRTPSLQPLRNVLEDVGEVIAQNQGSVPTQQAIQITKNINEIRNNLGSFKFDTDTTKRAARSALDDFYHSLRDNIYQDMNHQQPGLGDAYRLNSQGFAVYNQAQGINNFINRLTGVKLESDLGKSLFGTVKSIAGGTGAGMAIAGTKVLPSASIAALGVGGGLVATGAYQAGKLVYQLTQSGRLRQIYGNLVRSASEQNVGMTVKLLNQFDMEARKEEKKNKKANNR